MTKLAVALAALVWGGFLLPAQALTIREDVGGRIDHYEARWQRVAASGETVRIDGLCNSACTLLTGIVPASRVCVTPRAVLSFHAAWSADNPSVPYAHGVAELMRVYPASIRSYLNQRGGLTSVQRHIRLTGAELRSFYRACP